MQPNFGLVCTTHSTAVRYRNVTLARYKHFPKAERGRILEELYRFNLKVLFQAIEYCSSQSFALYRLPANLFPLYELPDGVGFAILEQIRPKLAFVGQQSAKLGVRLVAQPERTVLLNSPSDSAIENSIQVLENLAQLMDWMGLPKSTWAALNIRGGKAGRAELLAQTITHLNHSVFSRLTLENDESAYGAAEILGICQRLKIPMVFDVHNHLVRERLESYEDPSIERFIGLAAQTWPKPEWQLMHLSNGRTSLHDRSHHDLVQQVPSSILGVPWIEVEAKHKEVAVVHLHNRFNPSFAAEVIAHLAGHQSQVGSHVLEVSALST